MKKVILPVLALIVSLTGVYIGWKQYQKSNSPEADSKPNVLVCLESFTYYRSDTRGTGENAISVPKGNVSLRLVNKGRTGVTVTQVMLNPVGTWPNGQHGGLGSIYINADIVVPAMGVTDITNHAFKADFSVREKFWVDNPEYVNVQAKWPGGSGTILKCVPGHSKWSCGQGDGMSILVDNACY